MHRRNVVEYFLGLIREIQIEEAPEVTVEHRWVDTVDWFLTVYLTARDRPWVFLTASHFSPVQQRFHIRSSTDDVIHRVRPPLFTTFVSIELTFFGDGNFLFKHLRVRCDYDGA